MYDVVNFVVIFVQDGSVVIPDVLQPYMDNQKVISKLESPITLTFSAAKKSTTHGKGSMSVNLILLLINYGNMLSFCSSTFKSINITRFC